MFSKSVTSFEHFSITKSRWDWLSDSLNKRIIGSVPLGRINDQLFSDQWILRPSVWSISSEIEDAMSWIIDSRESIGQENLVFDW